MGKTGVTTRIEELSPPSFNAGAVERTGLTRGAL
jgi:hypothetical protein